MSTFSAEWLALREPADWRARSTVATEAAAEALPRSRVVRALDLAAGAGSNARFLSSRLQSPAEWLLVDHDPLLLQTALRQMEPGAASRVVDLNRLEALPDVFDGRDLVTASALLDLVSDDWLRRVCSMCRARSAVVLFALTYDGRMEFWPEDPDDALVRRLVNRHQRTNKGLGPALGPDASNRVVEYLAAAGYEVVRDRSDWVLDSADEPLQRNLVDGWAAASREMEPAMAAAVDRWQAGRLAHLGDRRSRIVVGHEDVAAFIA